MARGNKHMGVADGVHGPTGESSGRVCTGSVLQTAGRRSACKPSFALPTKEAAATGDLRNLGAAIPRAGIAQTCPDKGRVVTAGSELVRRPIHNMGDDCWENGVGAHRGEGDRVGQGSAARSTAHEFQQEDNPISGCDMPVETRASGQNETRLRTCTVEEGGGGLVDHGREVDGHLEAAGAEGNAKTHHGKDDEHNGEHDEVLGKTGSGTKAFIDRKLPMPNEEDGYDEDQGELEDEAQANYAEASDNEGLTLEEQLLKNKRTWDLATESGAVLYDEEDDIMAMLQ
ncbi:hypothetical protein AHAS_Ahas05G0093700 [Arachis hypogaea]